MNHIAATLLISLSGKTVDKKGIEDTLASAGSKPNQKVIDLILAAIKGKKPEDVVKDGLGKLISAVGAPVAAAASAAPAKEEAKKDDKKGAKKDEKPKKKAEPEEDDDVGFGGLF